MTAIPSPGATIAVVGGKLPSFYLGRATASLNLTRVKIVYIIKSWTMILILTVYYSKD